MTDELLDLVDKNDNVIGTVSRSEAHNSSDLIHREVGIAVFNDNAEILLQQRSFNKTNGPGMWDISSVGHVGVGENPAVAISRELEEELGIVVKPIYFDKFFQIHSIKGEHKEARFTWVYYALVKGHPKLKLQKDEVNDAKWVEVGKINEFAKENDFRLERELVQMTIQIADKINL